MTGCFWECSEHAALQSAAEKYASGALCLKELLKDEKRCERLMCCAEGLMIDASRSLIDQATLDQLYALYKARGVSKSLDAMYKGDKINGTENRAVGHVALRGAVKEFVVDGIDYIPEVEKVKSKIFDFADRVRSGTLKGHTGKLLTDLVCIGIGGSYLGIEFIHEAFRTFGPAAKAAEGRRLRFLANVDPIDIKRALEDLCPETTLVMVLSKTFTTAETMLNANTVRTWILDHYKQDKSALSKHLCAVSTNIKATSDFGIDEENVFGFWDWVGGRFSVCSAVGVLPLALQYGRHIVEEFLTGCRAIDQHVLAQADHPEKSLAALMALVSFYNSTYLKLGSVAVLPYCQALCRFPAHIQQLTMESNGKRVTLCGKKLPCDAGEVYFGEPGTNGQHSFYQLIHQGRCVPCEFIGFKESQNPVKIDCAAVSNHDELMSNFFAQPDALALGKTIEQLTAEGVAEALKPHRVFPGNRPSMCLLFDGSLTPATVGKLLALYEHRVAIEGFLWGVNSFDQFGVELGKVLAKDIRQVMVDSRKSGKFDGKTELVGPTRKLLERYFS